MSGGDDAYNLIYEEPGITSQSDQLVRILACPHKVFYVKILNPKDDGSFILESLTNRSHQVNSRILTVPCFSVVVHDETS